MMVVAMWAGIRTWWGDEDYRDDEDEIGEKNGKSHFDWTSSKSLVFSLRTERLLRRWSDYVTRSVSTNSHWTMLVRYSPVQLAIRCLYSCFDDVIDHSFFFLPPTQRYFVGNWTAIWLSCQFKGARVISFLVFLLFKCLFALDLPPSLPLIATTPVGRTPALPTLVLTLSTLLNNCKSCVAFSFTLLHACFYSPFYSQARPSYSCSQSHHLLPLQLLTPLPPPSASPPIRCHCSLFFTMTRVCLPLSHLLCKSFSVVMLIRNWHFDVIIIIGRFYLY